MSLRIRLDPAARDEFREAIQWYETARQGLGDEFRLEVESYVERAAARELPGTSLGSRHSHALRKLFLHRFPFALIFEIQADELVVWAVAHTKRRPGFWRSRI